MSPGNFSRAAEPPHSAPREAIERLFREPARQEWFAESFLAAVPLSQITPLFTQLTQQYGALEAVAAVNGGYLAKLGRAEVRIEISLDASGRIAGLFMRDTVVLGKPVEALAAEIEALPGKAALLVLADGKARIVHNADEPMAVASAAKLAILAALDDAVKQGRLRWDQVVPLDPAWKSLPTSILIQWPAGTPVTIATLANLMISVSDNMATDALIALVGTASIEAITPRNTPFPNTAQLFKLHANGAELAAWEAEDAAAKRTLLDKIDKLPLPRVDQLTRIMPAAEWFFSARELCALLDRVAALPAMAINPGLADAKQWQAVAFKGGSDSGVLNLSTRLVAKSGTVYCVVANWNNSAALAEQQMMTPYKSLLRSLADSG